MGAGEMAQWEKGSLRKQEELSSDAEQPTKRPAAAAHQ